MAAVMVLSICAAGLMASLASGFRSVQYARENQRATQIFMEQAELIRLFSWDQVTNGVVPTSFTAVYDPQAANGGGLTYTGKVSVASIPTEVFSTSYGPKMRRVMFTLTWNTKNIAHNRTNYTLVAKDGFQNYVY